MFRCLKRGPGFYGYLWRLTGPIALQNLITFSLGLIDTLMVSWLGNTQMAAVTTANVPVFLLISIVFGVQSGLGILVSQYWGKKDMESISRAIGVAAMLGTGITLVLALVLFLWPVQIMDLLSNKHELSVLGAPYLKLIGFSYVFNMLSSIYVSAMRSAENSGFGMKLFGVSTLLNTGMNYLLIFGKCGLPALGIQGAAIATLLSRVAEFLICLVCALRSRILPLDLAAFFRPGWEMLRRFVKYSTPVILNETAWGLGNSLLTVILGYTDNSVEMLAANAVMGNLNRLFLVVCFGLGAATAVMVGKAIGEGQSHREVMDLSRTLLVFTLLVGTGLAAVSLALVPTLFVPVVFPLFKLTGQSAAIAAALAVTSFVMIPLHAYSISAVTGVLLAFVCPVQMPYWMILVGDFFAIVVVKQLFGGIGQNFVNPALTARIILMNSFPAKMTAWTAPMDHSFSDAMTTATPLGVLSEGTGAALPSYLDMFLGNTGGCLGETCALALILGGIYLVARRVISPVIPVTYLATAAVLSALLGRDPLMDILSGGLLLGAIFMATDYTTSPINFSARVIYAVGCGVLTILIRQFASLPEGVSYSIVLMNILVPLIERVAKPQTFGKMKAKKAGDAK